MRFAFFVLTCSLVTGPCGSGSPSAGGGGEASAPGSISSGSSLAAPDGFVAATVGGGSSAGCTYGSAQSWLDVGQAVAGKPTTVQDGAAGSAGTVHVACSVVASGTGFDVNLSLTEAGTAGGSLTITSPEGQGAVTMSGGQGISAVFASGGSGTYAASGCTIAFKYNGETVPDAPPIAAGRIWGHVSCPAAQLQGGTDTCDAEADFLFEQCPQ